jgi:hypothetical protein
MARAYLSLALLPRAVLIFTEPVRNPSNVTNLATARAELRPLEQLQDELDRVLAAVAQHRDDDSPGADARLYAEVLGEPMVADGRVDDPNDWPDP